MRRHLRPILLILVITLLVLVGVGYLWLANLPEPMPEARLALASDEAVTVEDERWLEFIPAQAGSTGFVFYPGGRVPAEAYAPAVRAIAEEGYVSVIVPMPFGLAVLAPDAADDVIESYPQIDGWVIGGHSLGGAMAAQYAAGRDAIEGLALWAAYPPGDTDLSDSDLVATSIYASEDGLTTLDEIEVSAAQLPPDTVFVEIEGGNHAGFGWYGPQDGDGEASISRGEQGDQTVAATLEVLAAVDSSATEG